jgi:hypothetical protein
VTPVRAANAYAPARWYAILNGALLAVLAGGALLLFSLEVTPANTVRVPWADLELPQTCQFVLRTGKPCPSCGITRSLVSAAHGDFATARAFHFGGPPIWFMLLAQLALRVAFLRPAFRRPLFDLVVSASMLIAFAVLLN